MNVCSATDKHSFLATEPIIDVLNVEQVCIENDELFIENDEIFH